MKTNDNDKVSTRAKLLKEIIPAPSMSMTKLGYVIGCADSYFRTASGVNPSPIIIKRIKTLFPNLNLQWLFYGEGEILIEGTQPIAPLDILRLSAPKIKTVMQAAYGTNRELAEKLLLENDIDPDDLYNRYPDLFPILAPAEPNPTHIKDDSQVEFKALPLSSDDRDIVIAQLQTENRQLRAELAKCNATITHFLELAMKYIETKEGNK